MTRPEHDLRIVALGEIYELAAAIEAQSRIIRDYCLLGYDDGLELAVRGARDCLVRLIGEFKSLPSSGRASE